MKLKNMRIDEVSLVDKAANKRKFALIKRDVQKDAATLEAEAKAKAEADRVAAEKAAADKVAMEKAAADKAKLETEAAEKVRKEQAEAAEAEALLSVNKDIKSVMEIIGQL